MNVTKLNESDFANEKFVFETPLFYQIHTPVITTYSKSQNNLFLFVRLSILSTKLAYNKVNNIHMKC